MLFKIKNVVFAMAIAAAATGIVPMSGQSADAEPLGVLVIDFDEIQVGQILDTGIADDGE